MPVQRRIAHILIALVLAFGVLLRAGGLETKVLWHDEVYTRIFASGYQSHDWREGLYTAEVLPVQAVRRYQHFDERKSVLDTVRGLAEDEPQHPPVYYVLARVWLSVFGDGIGALRSLSAVAGLAGIPAMFWLCLELFDRRRAWLGAALMASSPFFVLYAQEAREYALWATLLVLATAALLRAIRTTEFKERPSGWALYALLVALALYTSFSTAAVAISHVLYIVVRERGRFTRVGRLAAAWLSVSALAFLPWAWMLWTHFEAFQASMAWSKIIVIPRSELLLTLALNASRMVVDLWHGYDHPMAYVSVGVCALLFLVACVSLVRGTEPRVWMLVVLLIVVPIGMLLGPDLVFGGIRSVSARYLIPAWIGLQLSLVHFLGRRNGGLLVAAVVGLGLLSGVHNARQQVVWTKGVSVDLPEVAARVNARERALIIGNRERHHPGNLHALANLLDDDVHVQLLWTGDEVGYRVPEGYAAVFLYSPTPPFVAQLEAEGFKVEPRLRALHLELYEVLR